MSIPSVVETMLQSVKDEAKAQGRDITDNLEAAREYAAIRMANLARAIGEPGYLEAVKAVRNAILLRLGINATNSADAIDTRLQGILQGALIMGSRALLGA